MLCTGSFISPKLEEALQSIDRVVAAFERDVRSDTKWDSALVRETASTPRGCKHETHQVPEFRHSEPGSYGVM